MTIINEIGKKLLAQQRENEHKSKNLGKNFKKNSSDSLTD
jgi:hypothetical protein